MDIHLQNVCMVSIYHKGRGLLYRHNKSNIGYEYAWIDIHGIIVHCPCSTLVHLRGCLSLIQNFNHQSDLEQSLKGSPNSHEVIVITVS